MILTKKYEHDFITIGIIEEWVNQNTKGDQLALFLFNHFCFCPMCQSTLEYGLLPRFY